MFYKAVAWPISKIISKRQVALNRSTNAIKTYQRLELTNDTIKENVSDCGVFVFSAREKNTACLMLALVCVTSLKKSLSHLKDSTEKQGNQNL